MTGRRMVKKYSFRVNFPQSFLSEKYALLNKPTRDSATRRSPLSNSRKFNHHDGGEEEEGQ